MLIFKKEQGNRDVASLQDHLGTSTSPPPKLSEFTAELFQREEFPVS